MSATTRKKKTAVSAKAPAPPMTNQERFNKLRDRIMEAGSILWETECRVNVYEKTHLEVSAGGYVKYDFHGCDTPAKILDGMRTTLKGVVEGIKTRRDELTEALSYTEDALEV